jgi:uncharacterized membrane protein YoaK (UPF0700 family)
VSRLRSESSALQVLPPALAFVAGFLDAATLVRGGGILCAHVTGNLVVIASCLVRGVPVNLLTASILPTFLVVVALTAVLHRRLAAAGVLHACRAVLWMEIAFVTLACSLDAWSAAGTRQSFVVMSLVMAMAAQNTLHRTAPGLGIMTTAMTGNLVQCLLDFADWRPRTSPMAPARTTSVLVGFAIGCASGGALAHWFGFGTLVVPICVLWTLTRVTRAAEHSASEPEHLRAPAQRLEETPSRRSSARRDGTRNSGRAQRDCRYIFECS